MPEPKPAVPSTTIVPATADSVPAENAPERERIRDEELAAIIEATGFEGLRGHELSVVERFSLTDVDVVAISLDVAAPSVPLAELKADVEIAEALAAQRLSFDTEVTVGPDNTRKLTFEILPTHEMDSGRETRYFIFAGPEQDLVEVAAPVTIFPDAYTGRFPYENMSVSILSDNPGQEHHGGVSANSKWAMVEAIQGAATAQLSFPSENQLDQEHNAGTLDLSFIQDPNYPEPEYVIQKGTLYNLGMEAFANSEALALAHAQAGTPYEVYSQLTTDLDMELELYPEVRLQYFSVSTERYMSFDGS